MGFTTCASSGRRRGEGGGAGWLEHVRADGGDESACLGWEASHVALDMQKKKNYKHLK